MHLLVCGKNFIIGYTLEPSEIWTSYLACVLNSEALSSDTKVNDFVTFPCGDPGV